VDHDDAPSDARRASDHRGPGRRRAGSVHNSARVAAAAKEALDGFQGVPRHEPAGSDTTTRAPGVRVLFGASAPAGERVTDDPAAGWDTDPIDPTEALDDGADDGPDDGPDRQPPGSVSPVWNPFRQAPAPSVTSAEADPVTGPTVTPTGPTGPRIVGLHTRESPTDVTVIATVEHHGRRAHGTSVGPPAPPGRLEAVAEATLAALRMLAAGGFPVVVEQVTPSSDDEASVSVELAWSHPRGRRRLVGERPTDRDPARAVMQATLDAARPCLAAPGTPGA